MLKCAICEDYYSEEKARLKEHLRRTHNVKKGFSNFLIHTNEKPRFFTRIKKRFLKRE